MSWAPLFVALTAIVCALLSGRCGARVQSVLLPLCVFVFGLCLWHVAARDSSIFPTPLQVATGLVELAQRPPDGSTPRLWKYIVASLFRVAWGFSGAVLIGVPFGLVVGWSVRSFRAFNPIIQGLRPISPIAWIPISILWFGVGDGAAVFLIFLASFFPVVVGTMAAVRNISQVHVRSAQNFGLHGLELFRRLVLPAALPQIITSLRLALGVAWLVVVAAEMIAVNSGLGYLINDARNMGMRYDLVVAGMLVIGAIGIVLDLLIRGLEHFDEVRWGYAKR